MHADNMLHTVFRVGFTVPNAWNYGDLPRFNSYSDTDSLFTMAPDQVSKLNTNRHLGSDSDSATNDMFFVLSWTLTAAAVDYAIHQLATGAFGALASWAFDTFTPYSFPNVLLVDFIGTGWDVEPGDLSENDAEAALVFDIAYLAMAINLQIASGNCWVTDGGD
jgi:hypothetical protein